MTLEIPRLRLVALLASAVLVAACSPPPTAEDADVAEPDPAEDTTADDDTDPAEAPEETLVVARTGDIDNLDPHLATAFQTYQALELVYDTLFELDADLEVVGGLAEDWSFDDEGTTLTLELRDGVAFHDGEAFGSGDVAASLERILDEETGAVARSNLLAIETIDTPDEGTVELTLSEPDGTLPAALADVNTAIVSQAAVEAETIGSDPNGTGPFAFEDWTQGEVVRLAANGDYWGGAPGVAGIDIRVIPDESSVFAGLQAGEFHVGIVTDPTVATQAGGGELVVERTPALAYRALMLNTTVEPLGDEQVRQAISCAIDREELIDSAALGEGEITGPFTTPAYASEPSDGLPCDPPDVETAAALLEEADHADGFALNTIVLTGEYPTAINEAQSLQAQLAEIGVDLQLEQLETNVYVDRWLAADFDAAVALNGGRPDPHHSYARYFTSDGNLNEVATHSSDELDDLFAEGRAETDPDARRDVYAEISRSLLEASPWAWLFTGFEYRILQPGVEGFTPMPNGSLQSLREVTVSG